MQDGLVLWLDVRAQKQLMKNGQDKTIWKDISGNGNDGELRNFGYTEDSGWVDGGLKFDGVDDYVQLPDLALNPDNFTIQVDNKIRAFNGDKVITENGDEWGRNLVIGSNYLPMNSSDNGNHNLTLVKQDENGEDYFSVTPVNNGNIYFDGGMRFSEPRYEGEIYTLSFDIMTTQNSNWGFYFYTNRSGNLIVRNNPSTNGKWERFTYTFTQESTKDDNILFGFHQLIAGEEIGWRKLKLEKGSQATPWTPAPEDIIETNIINHNTPFVENKKVHSFKIYNRALTDEEILQNYRATHFLLEPKTFTSTSYYNFYDLNRVEINTLATKDLAEVLRGDIDLENIDFDRNMKSIPFADILNKVEGNINILGSKLYKPKGWISPKLDWRYNQPFSYEDANRLERNLLLLYNYVKGNIEKIPYCGAYTCGEEVI